MRRDGHGSTLLCLNCMRPGAVMFPVGREKGNQRDPYREEIPLCGGCRDALESGDIGLFLSCYVERRTLDRDDLTPATPEKGTAE